MRRYKIKVYEVKTTEFELDGKNKTEAMEMVGEIINKTKILNLKCVEHEISYNVDITRVKRENK